jgi:hypothetical protein
MVQKIFSCIRNKKKRKIILLHKDLKIYMFCFLLHVPTFVGGSHCVSEHNDLDGAHPLMPCHVDRTHIAIVKPEAVACGMLTAFSDGILVLILGSSHPRSPTEKTRS